MPAGPPNPRAHPAHLLLTHLNRVSAQTRQLGARATKLTERVPHALEQLGVLLDHEARAVRSQILLIREHAQQHVARWRLSGLGEPQDRPEHHRHTALHVQRASTPNLALDQLGGERIVTPALAIRRDHVDVTLEQERRRDTPTRQPRQQVRPRRILGQDPRLQASSVAEILDPPHAPSLVAGRIGRVEPDQLSQQLDRIGRHGAGPYRKQTAGRGDGYHRVPLTDALIAAAAAEHGGIAVFHRDTHFDKPRGRPQRGASPGKSLGPCASPWV